MREINVVSRVRISENGKAVLYEKRYHGICPYYKVVHQ